MCDVVVVKESEGLFVGDKVYIESRGIGVVMCVSGLYVWGRSNLLGV